MPVNWRSFVIATWLFVIASASVVFVVYSLSAFQIQARIQSFSANGQNFSVWHIKRLSEKLKDRKQLLEPARQQVSRAEAELQELNNALGALKKQEIEQSAALAELEGEIAASLTANGVPYAVDSNVTYDVALTNIEARIPDLGQGHQFDQDQVKKFRAGVVALRKNFDDSTNLQQKIQDSGEKVNKAREDRRKAELAAQSLFGTDESVQQRDEDKIEDFLDELEVLDNLKFLGLMTQTPQELLTIVLVLVMGILGSTIYLTQVFVSGDGSGLSVSFYIFRPFFGALTALALFVVVKAGVLIAVDPYQQDTPGTALNPFFVSFIGIVGGLISEQAVEKIRSSAQNWLKTSVTAQNRWAVGVKKQIEEQDKSVSELASFFDDDEATIEGWINEKQTVPPDAQRIISAWLGKPPRTLFTNIQPDNAAGDRDNGDADPGP